MTGSRLTGSKLTERIFADKRHLTVLSQERMIGLIW
jgi:hypothetical protein